MENDFASFEKEVGEFITSLEKTTDSQMDVTKTEQNTREQPPYFIALINGIQNSLRLMKNYTKISQTNESDNGLGQYFSRISDEIENLETVISCFLKFNRLSTPIKKTNTIHNLIEEVLKKHENRLAEREILIFRRFEDNLPETIVPDELLKYILNSVLQYAIALTSPGYRVSTRSPVMDDEGEKDSPCLRRRKGILRS
jgi:nitrogen-specific signal transduction histidine kinase